MTLSTDVLSIQLLVNILWCVPLTVYYFILCVLVHSKKNWSYRCMI